MAWGFEFEVFFLRPGWGLAQGPTVCDFSFALLAFFPPDSLSPLKEPL